MHYNNLFPTNTYTKPISTNYFPGNTSFLHVLTYDSLHMPGHEENSIEINKVVG